MPSASRLIDSRAPINIGFLIGALALVLAGVLSFVNTRRVRSDHLWVEQTHHVVRVLEQIDDAFPDSTVQAPSEAQLNRVLSRLERLVSDNPEQTTRAAQLRRAITAGFPDTALIVVDSMKAEEQRLRVQRVAQADAAAIRSMRVTVMSTLLAVVFMAIALSLLHTDLERKRRTELALQDSEAKHRLLMEQAADAILIIDSNAICVEGNARAAEIIGRPRSEIPGLPMSTFVRGMDGGSTSVLPMLRYGHVSKGEFWVVRPDGSRIPVEVRATILEDGRVQVIARDVAERKEVERLKDQFISMVSHELRTPLTAIRGALGLLTTEKLRNQPEKQRRMIDLAATNTDRLIRLINDILDIERINSGSVVLDRTSCSVPALIEQAVEAMNPMAERAGVSLRWTSQDVNIWAEADRITQTLTNLVGNAIKFSPPGGTIDVAATKDGAFALFEVRDRGRGIPADKLAAIFDRFQQVDASDSREKGGTGLGLSISRSIVQQHGGRIWVESVPEQGSVFWFTIPLVASEARIGPEALPDVLICDADEAMLETLSAAFQARGCRTAGALGGREAIARFEAAPARLVIIDLVLPDISGVEVIRHIAAAAPQTYVVVYTTRYVEGADRHFIRDAGARIITKGKMTPQQLADEASKLLAKTAPARRPSRQAG